MPLIEKNRRQKTMDRLMSQSLGYVSGRWYDNGIGVATDQITTDRRAPDVLFGVPILLTRDVLLDRIAVENTQASIGASVYMGIYRNDNGVPGALLLDAGGASMSTTGTKELSFSLKLSQGWYWLAMTHNHSGPRTFRSYNYIEGVADLGFSSARATAKSLFVQAPVGLSPTPMPRAWPAGLTYPTDRPPRILVRVG